MPRNYTRKTQKNSWDPDKLQIALREIAKGRKIREVGRAFNIPESTLRKQKNAETHGTRLGCEAIFSPETEKQLKDYVLTLAKLFHGLTPLQLRKLAFRYAEEHQIKHRFSPEIGAAGKDWLYGFLKRNPEVKLRQPEGTSINRIVSFNAESVKKFFTNLKIMMDTYNFPPNRIFNMDETGVTVVQKKCPKVYGPKGAKKVGAVISAERGRTITAVFSVSAAGNYCPPMLIYPRKRMAPALQKNGPIGAVYACSKNGWITSDLFVEWLKHFQKNFKGTKTEPILLILDNHSSHISLEAYKFCKQNCINMVSLPPHTSDHLQPLDLTFFGPLKNKLYTEYDLHLTNTSHERITEYDVAELLNRAFLKVATMDKAISGFRTAGIFPLNPDRFTEDDFAAANEMRPLVVEAVPAETLVDKDVNKIMEDNVAPVVVPQSTHSLSERSLTPDPQPSTSYEGLHVTPDKPIPTPEPRPCTSSRRIHATPERSVPVQTPSLSQNSFFSFAPIPKKKVDSKTATKKCRGKLSSEILTATPMKEQLELTEQKRKIAADRKTVKQKLTIPDAKEKSNNKNKKKCLGIKKRKKEPLSETSDESDISHDLCDDDEQDDLNFFDGMTNASRLENSKEVCGICNEFGRNRELWYRCVNCSSWNHAACSGADRADGYLCDYCTNL